MSKRRGGSANKASNASRLDPNRLKKDPGVPNASLKAHLSGKKQILKAAINLGKKQQSGSTISNNQSSMNLDDGFNVAPSLLNLASSSSAGFSGLTNTLDRTLTTKDSSLKAYMKELRKVIDLSDVLLMVLDARDPMGCRSKWVEKEILKRESEGKRLIFVLNKIDLVPRENAESWLKYLRSSNPTIAFKASTQNQRNHLSSRSVGKSGALKGGSECLGADALIQLLKNYARSSAKVKSSIIAGIIGFPNVGKSSLINSLKRSRACGVGAMPGFTKAAQEVVLDKNIKLLDSPGVVFVEDSAAHDHEDAAAILRRQSETLLRNVIKVELVEDPIAPVELILSRCQLADIQRIYDVPEFDGVTDFLIKVSLIRGRLGKGGIPDLDGTARQILRDYNLGRIPYYTKAPDQTAASAASLAAAPIEGASIVSSLAPAFELGDLFKSADNETLAAAGTAISSMPRTVTGTASRPEEAFGHVTVTKRGREEQTEHYEGESESYPPLTQNLPSVKDFTQDIPDIASNNPLSRGSLKKQAKAEAKERKRRGLLPVHGPGGEGELLKTFESLNTAATVPSTSSNPGKGLFSMFGIPAPAAQVENSDSDSDSS